MNFKKLSAAVLAAGMALTAAPVFAADSPNPNDKFPVATPLEANKVTGVNVFEVKGEGKLDGDYTLAVDKDPSKTEVTALDTVVADTEEAAKNRKEIIAAAGYDLDETVDTTVVLGAGYYELQNPNGAEVSKLPNGEAMELYFNLDGAEDYKNIYVMHFVETKTGGYWEVSTADVVNGVVKVKMNSLSPLAFIGAKNFKGEPVKASDTATNVNKVVPTAKDGSKPEGGWKAAGDNTNLGGSEENNGNGGATNNGGANNGGSVNAGSTIANKVSPNTAA